MVITLYGLLFIGKILYPCFVNRAICLKMFKEVKVQLEPFIAEVPGGVSGQH